MNSDEVDIALSELEEEGLIEAAPPELELIVKRTVHLKVNATVALDDKSRLKVEALKGGLKISFSKQVKINYYRRRTDTTTVTIPVEYTPYVLEALQAVVDQQAENSGKVVR